MKAADLREKSADDLRELQKSLARDVFQNRLKNFTNRLDDTSAIRKTRRDLARVITLLREREVVADRSEPAEKAAASAEAPPPIKAKSETAPPAASGSKPEKSSVAKKAAASSREGAGDTKKSSTKAKKSEAK
jgi:large subunit ribosomal protein L29